MDGWIISCQQPHALLLGQERKQQMLPWGTQFCFWKQCAALHTTRARSRPWAEAVRACRHYLTTQKCTFGPLCKNKTQRVHSPSHTCRPAALTQTDAVSYHGPPHWLTQTNSSARPPVHTCAWLVGWWRMTQWHSSCLHCSRGTEKLNQAKHGVQF